MPAPSRSATPRKGDASASPAQRFREADAYRARREWLRYEGTGQRDLYRQLRERFLRRHATDRGWALDLGSGPGRFLPFAVRGESRLVALDLSRAMLSMIPESWEASGLLGAVPARVLGDARRPPLSPGRWTEVVALGNPLGFAGREAERMLDTTEALVAPGGLLVLEIAPSTGERARYLARLPPASVARLLRAPPRAVVARIDREGFRPEPARRVAPGSFRRFTAAEMHERWRRSGWEVLETLAVAPVLGPDAARTAETRQDLKAWSHLLEIEEELGRRPERWSGAAAVLLAVRRPPSKRGIK